MKFVLISLGLLCSVFVLQAQVGIGTASPNSTLDIRGSVAPIYRSYSTATTTITSTDFTVAYTGTVASTATLPDATTCAGRIYVIKNFSTTSPAPVLTLATVSSQKIDGSSTWLLDETNETVTLLSDGANWEISGQDVPVTKSSTTGGSWNQGGNRVTGTKSIGTISNYDFPVITNNTEKMRVTTNGYVGIGSTTFATSPEALLVYQNNATSFNVISGKGNLNNYLQLNIQNLNAGTGASSDLVATADNGNESTNYVDLGINSSAYSSTGITGGINNAYLYSAANDFVIGNSTAAKNLLFFTGGTATGNERMRITGNGNVGIGSSSFATNAEALLVYQNDATSYNVISGKGSLNNYLQLNIQNNNNGSSASSDIVATADNGSETANYVDLGINSSTYSSSGITGGADNAYLYSAGNDFVIGNSTSAKNLMFFTGGTATTNERIRITGTGNVGIGNTSPAALLDVNGTVKIGTAGTALNSIIRFTNQSITDNVAFDYTTSHTSTLTLTGVTANATVIVTPRSAMPTGMGIGYAYASAANTVKINFTQTGSAQTMGTIVFDITVIQ